MPTYDVDVIYKRVYSTTLEAKNKSEAEKKAIAEMYEAQKDNSDLDFDDEFHIECVIQKIKKT